MVRNFVGTDNRSCRNKFWATNLVLVEVWRRQRELELDVLGLSSKHYLPSWQSVGLRIIYITKQKALQLFYQSWGCPGIPAACPSAKRLMRLMYANLPTHHCAKRLIYLYMSRDHVIILDLKPIQHFWIQPRFIAGLLTYSHAAGAVVLYT